MVDNQRAESELRVLVEAIPDLIMRISGDGVYLDYSPPTYFQMVDANLVGRRVAEVLPPAIAQKRLELVQHTLATQAVQVMEYTLEVNGEVRYEESRAVPIGDDEVLLIVRDISDRARLEIERQRAEEQLRRSEAELKALFLAMNDVVMVFDQGGMCLRVAAIDPEDLIKPSDQQVGRNLREILPPTISAQFIQHIQETLTSGETVSFEYQLSMGDRDTWFSAKVSPLSATTVLMVARDVTNLKQAEQAARESEAELRSFFAAMPDVTMVFDQQGVCLKTLAPTNTELFILPPNDLVGKTIAETLPTVQATVQLQFIRQCLESQKVITNIEYNLPIEDQERWFSATVSPLSETTVIWVARDITDRKRSEAERKQAEAALKASETELRNLINAMTDVIIVYDRDGRCLKIAPSNPDLLIKPPNEQVNHTVYENMPPAQAQLQHRYIRQCLETGQTLTIEYHLPINQQTVWFSANVSPLSETTVLWVARDISDRKQTELALQDSLNQLALANQEITSLNQKLASENLRMSAELAVTRQLQSMILPKDQELTEIDGLEIASFMEPAEEVGGDYYDVLHHNGSVKIGIGDVTGHGLESGMLMLMVQTAVRTLLINQETDVVKFWNTLNRVIYDNAQRMNADRNITLALVDYQQGHLSLSGQHEKLILVRADGAIEEIDTIDLGMPLGLIPDITQFVAQKAIFLSSGDGVVLYTDGVTEAENQQREQYGLERLCAIVQANWQHSAQEVRQAIIQSLQNHIDKQKVYDDVTLLVLKQK